MPRKGAGRSGKNPYAKPDVYAVKAKTEGYPARSVYKLEEIDRRAQLLKGGQRVLDLGCAPGSWMLYAAKRVGDSGRVRGIDLTPLEIGLPRNASAMVGNALEPTPEVRAFIEEGGPYDVVLSDMAPSTTGNRFTDQVRSAELVLRTLDVARDALKPGGAWVAKLFMSGEIVAVRKRVREMFADERVIRPESTRQVSYEVFLIGIDKRPAVVG